MRLIFITDATRRDHNLERQEKGEEAKSFFAAFFTPACPLSRARWFARIAPLAVVSSLTVHSVVFVRRYEELETGVSTQGGRGGRQTRPNEEEE